MARLVNQEESPHSKGNKHNARKSYFAEFFGYKMVSTNIVISVRKFCRVCILGVFVCHILGCFS